MKKIILISCLFYTLLNSYEIESSKIDINKKGVALGTTMTLASAKDLSIKFLLYDTYIKKTTTTEIPYFVVFAVNIKKEELHQSLVKIKKLEPTAYIISNNRIKQLHNIKPSKKQSKIIKHQSIKMKYQQAKKYYQNREYEKAIVLLEELVSIDATNSNINFYLGSSYYNNKEYEKAMVAYERITIVDEQHLRGKLELAQTYLNLGLIEEAIKNFNLVLQEELPQNVRDNINYVLENEKNKKQKLFFDGSVSMTMTLDNNPASSAEIKDYNYYYNGELVNVDYTVTKYNELNYLLIFNTNLHYKINDNYTISNRFNYLKQIFQKDLDRLDLSANESEGIALESKKEIDMLKYSLSLSNIFNNHNITYSANAMKINLAKESYLNSYGASLSYQRKYFSDITIFSVLSYQQKQYQQLDNQNLDSNNFTFTFGHHYPTIQIGQINLIYIYGLEQRLEENINAPDKISNSFVLANNYKLSKEFALNSSIYLKDTKTQEKDVAFDIKQHDKTKIFSIELEYKINKNTSISSSIKHNKIDSNIVIYDYNKQTIDISIKKSF
ncbi:MAG: CDC27 family protein [Campylobacterota bacterium]|nr:CDC27 family protein [Campylobacterota bacterium]